MKYKTLYLDPPWKICTGAVGIKGKKSGKLRYGTPQKHYPVMDVKEIYNTIEFIEDFIDEQAHMYMWVVNNKIEDALWLINKLEFKYITNLVWVKNKIGLGQYFRGQHELLFFCRKGNPLPYKYNNGKKVTISSVHIIDREEHSKKPDNFYNIIESISYGPYLELFARFNRDNWHQWGPHENIDDFNSGLNKLIK